MFFEVFIMRVMGLVDVDILVVLKGWVRGVSVELLSVRVCKW